MWTHTKKKKDRGVHEKRGKGFLSSFPIFFLLAACSLLLATNFAFAEDLSLQWLINEALQKNPDLIAAGLKIDTARYKIPQAESLPDPMFMFGYQNEGYERYTFGEMPDAQWMFSVSQMFPFPGKLSLKGEMSLRDSESIKAQYDYARLVLIARIKELYYDLFLVYKDIDLIKEKTSLFQRIEDAALARYSAGMAPQQDAIMAQIEKYMLIEREEMLRQKKDAIEAMLNALISRDVNSPLGRPAEPAYVSFLPEMNELIKIAHENSPQIKAKAKMVEAADAKVRMAEREYYPDFIVSASLFKRRGEFEDMWSLTTAINIPIFYKTKQKMAVLEAGSALSETRQELEATKLMIASAIRENYSMLKTAERLMGLYKEGLGSKTYQNYESAVSGYISGKVEVMTVITRLKALVDYELLYWTQFAEREKAFARLEVLTGQNIILTGAHTGE